MRLLYFFLMIPCAMMAAESLPEAHWNFVSRYCTDCHDEDMNEGNLNLDMRSINWQSADVRRHFGKAYTMLERGKMPPQKKKKQPTAAEKQLFMAWLDQKLVAVSPVGGTGVRRLNRREYLNTVIDLFGIYGFQLPGSFPQDLNSHGFDTNAKKLVVSPSHFESYAESAIKVADYLFPPKKPPVKLRSWDVDPTDMTISYSSAFPVEGAMRLASKGGKTRNGTWPAKFEAPVSGTYKVEITASVMKRPAETPKLDVKSHFAGRGGKERSLKSFELSKDGPQKFTLTADLYRGENILFLYKNAPFAYEKGANFKEAVRKLFTSEPKLAAAWAKLKKVPRGGNGWARLKKTMADPKLDVSKFSKESKELEKVIADAAKNSVSSGETLVYKFFEEGPNIGIHNIKISGPLKLIVDPDDVKQKKIQEKFLGDYKKTVDVALEKFMGKYLTVVFRRNATAEEVKKYANLVRHEVALGRRIEEGLHLAVRTSLISPKFLYRETGSGGLTQSELASRLSYFLTSSTPDKTLMGKKNLSDSQVLRKQADRLLKGKGADVFIHDFTAQWLDTDALDTLMPDPKLFRKFQSSHRKAMKDEVETTFREILRQNMSVREFIDPDFIFTDSTIGKEIYGLKKLPKGKKGALKKVSIPRGSKKGGILSMPAVMMATANGVDTQPVLRGVWILENVLGTPPPEPPKNVPALPPDTSAAIGPREKLAAHMKSESCRSCHEDIDPMGFVLENFDPVGRWRDVYPKKGKGKSLKIDASATMPNGTKLNDIRDLKKFLVDNPVYFTGCLARKLMTYATGRELNYRENKIILGIVKKNIVSGNKFKDLLLDLIDSEVFKAR